MIATALVFLLGLLVALLVALLLAPVLWRKAQGFARREFEATVPLTTNEIRAEFDAVRAAAAMDVRRQEVAVADMRERMVGAQTALGRCELEVASLRKRARELESAMADFAAERDSLREVFAAHRDKERTLAQTLDEAKRDGSLNAEELEALALRFREMSDLAQERKVELVAAETRIERLTDMLRSVERANSEKDTLIRLLRREGERRGEGKEPAATARPVGAMPGVIPWTTPKHEPRAYDGPAVPEVSPAQRLRDVIALSGTQEAMTETDAAELRERIATLAAHVLHQAALAEGEGSPLAPLLRPSETGEARPEGAYLTLADRVRRLAATEGTDRAGR